MPQIYDPTHNVQPKEYVNGSANVMAIAKVLYEMALLKQNNSALDAELGYSKLPTILDYTIQSHDDSRARWTIVKYLQQGGHGTVYAVKEPSSNKLFAQKTMRFIKDHSPQKAAEKKSRREDMVRNEVEIVQKLRNHRHIVSIFFYAKNEEDLNIILDIIMLPIADKDLAEYLTMVEKYKFPPSMTNQLLEWTGCLIEALAFAHGKSVRHKDIKPGNILVKEKQVFLTDFGIAVDFAELDVSYTTNTFNATTKYRAPESEYGMPHGRQADIFSLGCVFSEMLTVSNRKSRDEFERSRPQKDGVFCKNIPITQKWVTGLKITDLKIKDKSTFLAKAIRGMLHEDPEERYAGNHLVEMFTREGSLNCKCA